MDPRVEVKEHTQLSETQKRYNNSDLATVGCRLMAWFKISQEIHIMFTYHWNASVSLTCAVRDRVSAAWDSINQSQIMSI